MSIKITQKDKVNLEGISNDRLYEIIAFLVDREEFIEDIRSVREKLGFKKPLSYSATKKWLSRKISTKGLSQMSKEDKEVFREKSMLAFQVSSIRQKHRISANFEEIVKYAILSNKVTDKQYNISAFCTIYPFEDESVVEDELLELSTVAIFINPETTPKEVKQLMSTEVKKLFKKIGDSKKVPIRKKSDIRDVRTWYWKKKKMTYNALCSNLGPGYTYEAVKRAVERYMKKLN